MERSAGWLGALAARDWGAAASGVRVDGGSWNGKSSLLGGGEACGDGGGVSCDAPKDVTVGAFVLSGSGEQLGEKRGELGGETVEASGEGGWYGFTSSSDGCVGADSELECAEDGRGPSSSTRDTTGVGEIHFALSGLLEAPMSRFPDTLA